MEILGRNNNGSFRWDEMKDKYLLMEVRVAEPYLHKIGSKEAGQSWTELADHLNSYEGFKEMPRDQRSVRERFNKLLNDFMKKMRKEEAATGIVPNPLNENETLLEEIAEAMKSASAEQSVGKTTDKKEREKAVQKDKAMKTWGKTQKESDTTLSESDESEPKQKRKRRGGLDALDYLVLKSKSDAELKKEELAFQKERVEVEIRRVELEKQKQEQLQEQMQLQQQQMHQQATQQQQQFHMMQQQMQQQMQMQSTAQALMMALFEKITKS